MASLSAASSADTAADAFLAALQAKLAEQPADVAEDFCRAELEKLKAVAVQVNFLSLD